MGNENGKTTTREGKRFGTGETEIQPELPRIIGAGLGGVMRMKPEDFRVEEIRLPEESPINGGHLALLLEKREWTTDSLAGWLARHFKTPRRGVGYAGLKDRHAVTVQEFSVPLPPKGDSDLDQLRQGLEESLPEGVRLLGMSRRSKKIRIGQLVGNRFEIRLRNIDGSKRQQAEEAVRVLRKQGVPNWFGPQRFGNRGDNAIRGMTWLSAEAEKQKGNNDVKVRKPKRHERGFLLSAVRSELFNRVLTERIRSGLFDQLLEGDVAQLDGRRASFLVESVENERPRFTSGAIHPTGPLFGRKLLMALGHQGILESAQADQESTVVEGLNAVKVDGARRALRVTPTDLEVTWEADETALIRFQLPKGSYATSVMREFMMEAGPHPVSDGVHDPHLS
ncbi:MAG: tRNA pseudouridine(13) synthase TruD [Magnetococcales bacterium]|nr:tRNA pseudouridine(13) synthase TruD [Magnetococcales bacterium]